MDGLAALLQAELADPGTRWLPGDLTFQQIREQRKKAGVPWGACSTYTWVAKKIKEGSMKAIKGHVKSGGRLVPAVRYRVT